jgi:alkaline phosphatase D
LAEDLGLPLNSVKLVEIADYGRSYDGGNPPEFLPYGDGRTANPAKSRAPGSCLGPTQRDWFLDTLQASTTTWKLWGNSLPLMPLHIDLSAIPFSGYEDGVISIDAWAGYPSEMKMLMSHIREQEITGVVSLSGDHHMHGASTISGDTSNAGATAVAADFACAGISSTPFFESIVAQSKDSSAAFRGIVYRESEGQLTPVWHTTMLRGALAAIAYARTGLEGIGKWLGPNLANAGLKYVDCTANGYGLAQFRAGGMEVQLVTMKGLREPFDSPPEIDYTAKFRIASWSPGEQPVLEGPEFAGGAPFPFEAEAV